MKHRLIHLSRKLVLFIYFCCLDKQDITAHKDKGNNNQKPTQGAPTGQAVGTNPQTPSADTKISSDKTQTPSPVANTPVTASEKAQVQNADATVMATETVPTEGDAPDSPVSQTPPPSEDGGETQEIILVNEHTLELDLNHGRIGKIEKLEPMTQLER